MENQGESNGVLVIFIAKSMQKEVFGLLSVIVKCAEVEMIN